MVILDLFVFIMEFFMAILDFVVAILNFFMAISDFCGYPGFCEELCEGVALSKYCIPKTSHGGASDVNKKFFTGGMVSCVGTMSEEENK